MKISKFLAIAAVVAVLVSALPAFSQIELRFSPPDQQISVGAGGSLSVFLDDAIEVRTIELWISYDPSIVTSLGGQPGQLFSDSGCPLFPFFEEDVLGEMYAGCVTMGPTCYLTGPGELYRWDFVGLAEGICQVQVDNVVLYTPLADVIEDVTLQDTTILVSLVSSVEIPSVQGLTLELAPNPFNPRTTISFGGRPNESVTVEVFDLKGGRVATLWEGILGSEPGVLQWDGTDRLGRTVPGGAYLFSVLGQGGRVATSKGILLK